jgi:hypothetical protein
VSAAGPPHSPVLTAAVPLVSSNESLLRVRGLRRTRRFTTVKNFNSSFCRGILFARKAVGCRSVVPEARTGDMRLASPPCNWILISDALRMAIKAGLFFITRQHLENFNWPRPFLDVGGGVRGSYLEPGSIYHRPLGRELFNIIKIFARAKTPPYTGTPVARQVQVLAASAGAFQTAVFVQRLHYLINCNFLMPTLTTSPIQIKLCDEAFYRIIATKCATIR